MRSADIVIIGGGIVGASLAYALSMRGASNIVLLERETLASGSSGRATGGLRQQFADELDIRFSIEGIRFYKEFTRIYAGTPSPNAPPQFLQYGYMFLCVTPESWQAMQGYVALQQSLGVPTQLLTPAEVQERVPQVIVDDIVGASFCPTDGYSDPGMMSRAIVYQAQQRGVTLYEQAPVTAITVQHGRVTGVQTPQETFATPLLINATGASAAFVARLAGIPDLPVRPLRRHICITAPVEDLPWDVPMVVDLKTGFHFRRRDGGVLLTMPTMPGEEEARLNAMLAPEAFALPVDETFITQVRQEARRRCPPLADAPIAQAWSGLYEMTPDEHPILGKTEVEGFLCACGFSGHGFMHTPMAVKLLTELILDGASATLDINQFSYERFRTGKLIHTTHLL
ncbi:MAG TPA: FAD-dependent oxidoreductase [Ktedonobacteraceae bacterium]|nr:FAD-dependent oxidoreductase [Ktedonobacteraceae bacterium]